MPNCIFNAWPNVFKAPFSTFLTEVQVRCYFMNEWQWGDIQTEKFIQSMSSNLLNMFEESSGMPIAKIVCCWN